MGRGAWIILLLGQLELGLSAMGGSAAWAQTQLTPGVSVRAAPHPNIWVRLDRAGQQVFCSTGGNLK
jgi:hypothetical protein